MDIDSRSVATGPIEAGDEACLDGVIPGFEHDRNRGCGRLGRLRCGRAERGDYRHLTPHEIGRQLREAIILTLRPAEFDLHIAALDISEFGESSTKRLDQGRIRAGRRSEEHTSELQSQSKLV